MEAGTAQQKFTSLRKRLDQLGYRHPLGIESLPLVERLFADLVHTTDSLKKSKLESTRLPSDNGKVDGRVDAYKSDNARLVKENNQLHQNLIRRNEDLNTVSAGWLSSYTILISNSQTVTIISSFISFRFERDG